MPPGAPAPQTSKGKKGNTGTVPELPEVETTRRGLEPMLLGRTVTRVDVRQPRLRWPVSPELAEALTGARIESVGRRAKYLLLGAGRGTVILHLGMSGSLRYVSAGTPAGRHDHVQWLLEDESWLRLHDPRRFGAVLWTTGDAREHPLLRRLGPEPLRPEFDRERLYRFSRHRRTSVKAFIMDSRVVAGIGNIYAAEALFLAGIHPARRANRIALDRYQRLTDSIRRVLADAIRAGGTTLRNFVDAGGRPGDFRRRLLVYGRPGEPCRHCGAALARRVIAQRSTVYCPRCQR